MNLCCRGIRGAITVDDNTVQAILTATKELLESIVAANGVRPEEIAAVLFSVTSDLDAAYPAAAARQMGWTRTPLMCLQEMTVPGSLPRCIRVLVQWNTERSPDEIRHIYLRRARQLRPDLVEQSPKEESSCPK